MWKDSKWTIILLSAIGVIAIYLLVSSEMIEARLETSEQQFFKLEQAHRDMDEAYLEYLHLQIENFQEEWIATQGELFTCQAKLYARSIIDRRLSNEGQAEIINDIDEIIDDDVNDIFINKEEN